MMAEKAKEHFSCYRYFIAVTITIFIGVILIKKD